MDGDISTQDLPNKQLLAFTTDSQELHERRGTCRKCRPPLSSTSPERFTVGASLFGKFEAIKDEGEPRKTTPSASSSTITAIEGGKNNKTAYAAFPAKLVADLVGGSGKIHGSHRYWNKAFQRFSDSYSISLEIAAALKEEVKRTRRSLRASRSLLEGAADGTGDGGHNLTGIPESELSASEPNAEDDPVSAMEVHK